jgi:hypothetical protein
MFPYISDYIQHDSLVKGPTRGSGVQWDHTVIEESHTREITIEAVRFTYIVRSCECRKGF